MTINLSAKNYSKFSFIKKKNLSKTNDRRSKLYSVNVDSAFCCLLYICNIDRLTSLTADELHVVGKNTTSSGGEGLPALYQPDNRDFDIDSL